MQIYVHRDNQQLGPFTEAEVRAQLAGGTLSLQDHVWWQGQQGWIPLSQSQFATPAGATPPVPGIPTTPSAPGAPVTPFPTAASLPTSKLAVWALVCGCLSLFCSIFAAIPAIVLGHMGLSETKKNPALQGRGMALAGVILGYVFTAFGLLYIAVVGTSVLIALGNQVKPAFQTIDSQLKSDASTNSSDDSSTNSDSSTNTSDQSTTTNSPDTSTNSPDTSTNSATATPMSPDQSTNSAPDTTNAPTTNQ
jgi:hypothetical protein